MFSKQSKKKAGSSFKRREPPQPDDLFDSVFSPRAQSTPQKSPRISGPSPMDHLQQRQQIRDLDGRMAAIEQSVERKFSDLGSKLDLLISRMSSPAERQPNNQVDQVDQVKFSQIATESTVQIPSDKLRKVIKNAKSPSTMAIGLLTAVLPFDGVYRRCLKGKPDGDLIPLDKDLVDELVRSAIEHKGGQVKEEARKAMQSSIRRDLSNHLSNLNKFFKQLKEGTNDNRVMAASKLTNDHLAFEGLIECAQDRSKFEALDNQVDSIKPGPSSADAFLKEFITDGCEEKVEKKTATSDVFKPSEAIEDEPPANNEKSDNFGEDEEEQSIECSFGHLDMSAEI